MDISFGGLQFNPLQGVLIFFFFFCFVFLVCLFCFNIFLIIAFLDILKLLTTGFVLLLVCCLHLRYRCIYIYICICIFISIRFLFPSLILGSESPSLLSRRSP